jgi:predicted nucleotidyltransferase
MSIDQMPERFRADIHKAIRILKSYGARDVFLFGSVLTATDPSTASTVGDLDIAVAGMPPENFFHAYGALTMDLESPFDLVDLDNDAAFVQSLRRGGRLERVA